MLDFIMQLQEDKNIKFNVLPSRNWLSNLASHARRILGIKRKK